MNVTGNIWGAGSLWSAPLVNLNIVFMFWKGRPIKDLVMMVKLIQVCAMMHNMCNMADDDHDDLVVVVVLNRRASVPLSRSDLTHCSSTIWWSQNQQRAIAHPLLSPCTWPMISAIGGIQRNLLNLPGSQFAGVLLMRPIFLRSLSNAGHSHHRCIGSSSYSRHTLHL